MLYVTTLASLDRSLWTAGGQLITDRWFQATLADAYFGFVTFYVWVAYKESGWGKRFLWFCLIMALGNIAMSIYMIKELLFWDTSQGAAGLLLRKRDYHGSDEFNRGRSAVGEGD